MAGADARGPQLMRYRKLDPDGDYSFGRGMLNFYIDQPEAVAQSVLTRLNLWEGQWFADQSQGVPWLTQVLGERTQQTRDVVVRETVNDTEGVANIVDYVSVINPDARGFSVGMVLDTDYGKAQLALTPLPTDLAPLPPFTPAPVTVESLGITSGETPIGMKRADLSKPGQAVISQFLIESLDRKRW